MTADGKSWLSALPSKILVLAAAYFVVGILTLAANIPPVIVTVVWLPAGIALTATLVWGYRVWPGILLGAFAAHAAAHLDASNSGTPIMTIVVSVFIGLGAVLQGFAGAYLILRFAGFPRSLNRLRKANVLLWGGPVSCLVSTAVGGIASRLAGSTPTLSLVGNWWNWWVAETLGVLIILPLVSVWLVERRRISLRMRLFVILPVCLATILTVLAFQEIRVGKWRRIQAEFTRKAQIMATTLGSNYTDGVLDHPNPAGKIFGKQRFYVALQKRGGKSVGPIMDSIQMTIKDFAGPASSGDDLSLMAIEYV